MSFLETVLLGAFAGLTIYIGLPFARVQQLSVRARVALAMFAVGILAFLFVDVMEHAFGIVEDAVSGFKDGKQSFAHVAGLALMLGVAFAAGCAGIATIESRLRRNDSPSPPPIAGGSPELTVDDAFAIEREVAVARTKTLRFGMTIAAAIGLHNFAEGLAIGVSARTGAIGLATVLIIGFALHNATEGFGIVGPLGSVRPSWSWLALAGLVGGGPTFLGTIVGYNVTSQPLELAFFSVSGGAILYVIGEVWIAMRRFGHRELGLWLVSLGFFVGIVTDLVVAYGGG